MSRELFKMNMISSVQKLDNEDIEIIQNYIETIEQENKQLKEKINKAIEYIKEYGRDKQLEEEYLMNAYNLAMYNISLLEILGDKE